MVSGMGTTDAVLFMNKLMILFFAVLGAGMLVTGGTVVATYYGVLHDDSGIVIGPDVHPLSIKSGNNPNDPTYVKIITEETYNGGMYINENESLKIEVIRSSFYSPLLNAIRPEFDIVPIQNGVALPVIPINAISTTPSSTGGLYIAEPQRVPGNVVGTYNIVLKGKQSAANYRIIISRLNCNANVDSGCG